MIKTFVPLPKKIELDHQKGKTGINLSSVEIRKMLAVLAEAAWKAKLLHRITTPPKKYLTAEQAWKEIGV